MEFSVNHPILFLIVGILIAVVLGQSVFFLCKALKRSKELGMDQSKIRKTIRTAAIFTIAPAVAIVISVITLSKKLGLALPWLRLSVVGSMSYETIAANNALSAMGQSLGSDVALTAQQFGPQRHDPIHLRPFSGTSGEDHQCNHQCSQFFQFQSRPISVVAVRHSAYPSAAFRIGRFRPHRYLLPPHESRHRRPLPPEVQSPDPAG